MLLCLHSQHAPATSTVAALEPEDEVTVQAPFLEVGWFPC